MQQLRALAFVFAALVALAPCAASAQSTVRGAPGTRAPYRVQVVPTGTYTSTYTSPWFNVGAFTECGFITSLSSVSGTSPTWATTIDLSWDAGTDAGPTALITGASLTATTNGQLISMGLGAVSNNYSFGDTIRVRAVIGGTSPSFTGQVTMICK